MINHVNTYLLFLLLVNTHLLSQKNKYVAKDVGTIIKILDRKGDEMRNVALVNTEVGAGGLSGSPYVYKIKNPDAKTDSIFIGIDSGYYKLKNEFTLVLMEHPNYKSTTDLKQITGFKAATKRLVLKKFSPLHFRKQGEAYIGIDEVSFRIESRKYKQFFYESYEDYLKGNSEREFKSANTYYEKRSGYDKDLEKFLVRTKHLDGPEKLTYVGSGSIPLSFDVLAMTEHKFGRFCVIELTTKVTYPPFFGDTRYKKYTTFSSVGFDDSNENESNNPLLILDALENIIVEILKDSEVNHHFLKPE
jgi:hypothetical protein